MRICNGTKSDLHVPIAYNNEKWDCPMCALMQENSELRSIIASHEAKMDEKGIR